jgi:putative DNA primase/helicase
MAAALTGKPVVVGEMAERGRAIQLKSGAEHVLRGRVYETPEAELVRQAVAENAVVQAVGRARGVNRTEDNPVEVVLILHDTTTPLPVDAVAEFSSIEPNAVEEMVGRGWCRSTGPMPPSSTRTCFRPRQPQGRRSAVPSWTSREA